MIRPFLFLILLTLFACGPTRLQAQVNIEETRRSDAENGFSTTATLSFSSRTGNVELTTLGGQLRTDFIQREARSFLLARGDLGWKDSDRFSNEGLIHARYTRRISGKLHFEIFSQFNYDKSRLLDSRFLGGGGVRIGVIDNTQITLSVGSAGMVEYERYDLPAGASHPGEATVSRWSNYINLKAAFSGNGSLVWIIYAQPRFDRFEDVRILSEATLAAGLSATVSLSVTARIRYDRDPPDGIEDLDTIILSGLRLEF